MILIDRNLVKFYFLFLFTLILFLNILPNLFFNINNNIDYFKFKITTSFKKNKNTYTAFYSNKANIIIMFDDGWKTQYTVAHKYMSKKNIQGSIAVIPSLVGQKDYLNKGELYKLYYDNWDILNHTYNHSRLDESNIEDQINEIMKADRWLFKNGFSSNIKSLIYPEGNNNSDTVLAMQKTNYKSGRTTNDGFNDHLANDLFNTKVKNVFSNIEVNEVYSWIDYSIKNNKTLILLFHKLENKIDESLMIYKIEDFIKIIDYIDLNRENVNIITYTEWIEISIFKKNEIISKG